MAYTAKITEIKPEGTRAKLFLYFTHDTDQSKSFGEWINVGVETTVTTLREIVRDRITQAQTLETRLATVAPEQVVPPAAAYVPSQEELDKKDFLTKLSKLRQLQELITLGVITDQNVDYTTLKTELQTEFNVNFLT